MTALRKALVVVAVVAAALWMGGIVALGAIAAPVVFRIVPPPRNADAMTEVFRRFDRVAMGAAAAVVLVEIALGAIRRPRRTREAARAAVATLASAVSVWQGVFLSPKIEALHAAGAVRGKGALGLDLEHAHSAAELCGKSVTLLLVALVVLHVFSLEEPRPKSAPASLPR